MTASYHAFAQRQDGTISRMSEAPNLACVKCNSILDRATFEGLEVDLCPRCGGLWLDRGEITRAARLPEAELVRLRTLLSDSGGPPPLPTESVVPCPACEGELSEVMLGKVHVDYCGTCHGIFLDRGELEDALVAVHARDKNMTAQQVVAAAISVAG
jgi:Zn-finger nucleic acid-binding protein